MTERTDLTNWVRKLEAIIKPVYLVGLFILLILFAFAKEARADEVSVELGATFLSGEYSEGQALILSERFGKYSVGVGYITEQYVTPRNSTRTFVMENVFIQGQRHVRLSDRFEFGLGVAYFNATNRALGSNFEFSLMVRARISDRFSVQLRHWSNAGSARPNMGQDVVTIAYHFGEQR